MPGMPVFQDSPSQLKGQIYVLNSVESEVLPLKLNATDNLPVAVVAGSTIGLEAGSAEIGSVGLLAGAADIGSVGIQAGQTVGIAAGTAEIGIVGLLAGSADIGSVGIQAGQTVGIAAGTAVIGQVQNDLVFTNVDSFGGTLLLSKTVVTTGPTVSESQDISKESSYNWFIKNNGTAANQNISLKVEISPDETNWLEDTGSPISVAFCQSRMITVTNFLKYARFTITAPVEETTVISCFQAQH